MEKALLEGLKTHQGSGIANSFMQVLIVLADLEGVVVFIEERHSSELS